MPFLERETYYPLWGQLPFNDIIDYAYSPLTGLCTDNAANFHLKVAELRSKLSDLGTQGVDEELRVLEEICTRMEQRYVPYSYPFKAETAALIDNPSRETAKALLDVYVQHEQDFAVAKEMLVAIKAKIGKTSGQVATELATELDNLIKLSADNLFEPDKQKEVVAYLREYIDYIDGNLTTSLVSDNTFLAAHFLRAQELLSQSEFKDNLVGYFNQS